MLRSVNRDRSPAGLGCATAVMSQWHWRVHSPVSGRAGCCESTLLSWKPRLPVSGPYLIHGALRIAIDWGVRDVEGSVVGLGEAKLAALGSV